MVSSTTVSKTAITALIGGSHSQSFTRRGAAWSRGRPGRGRLGRVPIDPARFWAKVSAVEEGPLGCWPWLGALARSDGRALLHDPDLGRPTQAARLAWQLNHAPVPDGLQVLHLYDHPWCVRPTHLVLGSQAANMTDRARKQWVRACSRPRYTDRPHDAYQTATQVRARHRKLAAAGLRNALATCRLANRR